MVASRKHPVPLSCSLYQALPGLRGFWPLSSADENGDAYDLSGQGRTLSYNGNPTYNYVAEWYGAYLDFDGTGDYLSRASEAGLEIIGTETTIAVNLRGLTIGGWFYVDSWPGAAAYSDLIGKTGAGVEAYWINADGTGLSVDFVVYNGAAGTTIALGYATEGEWFFACARFTPSTEMKLWVNETTVQSVIGIPATIDNTAADFCIGGSTGGGSLLDGRASRGFLCAAALPDDMIETIYGQTRSLFNV